MRRELPSCLHDDVRRVPLPWFYSLCESQRNPKL